MLGFETLTLAPDRPPPDRAVAADRRRSAPSSTPTTRGCWRRSARWSPTKCGLGWRKPAPRSDLVGALGENVPHLAAPRPVVEVEQTLGGRDPAVGDLVQLGRGRPSRRPGPRPGGRGSSAPPGRWPPCPWRCPGRCGRRPPPSGPVARRRRAAGRDPPPSSPCQVPGGGQRRVVVEHARPTAPAGRRGGSSGPESAPRISRYVFSRTSGKMVVRWSAQSFDRSAARRAGRPACRP